MRWYRPDGKKPLAGDGLRTGLGRLADPVIGAGSVAGSPGSVKDHFPPAVALAVRRQGSNVRALSTHELKHKPL